jgi:hypothetical protein
MQFVRDGGIDALRQLVTECAIRQRHDREGFKGVTPVTTHLCEFVRRQVHGLHELSVLEKYERDREDVDMFE